MESVGILVMKSQLMTPIPLMIIYNKSPPRERAMIKKDNRTMPKKSACFKYRHFIELLIDSFIYKSNQSVAEPD
jgi:hypothetical protein